MPCLARPVFWVAVGLFAANRLLEFGGWAPAFARGYLDDLLCFPIVLTLVLCVQQMLRRDKGAYRLPFSHGLTALALYALVFEWMLPHYWGLGTADARDVLAYGLGVLIFYLFINKGDAHEFDRTRGTGAAQSYPVDFRREKRRTR